MAVEMLVSLGSGVLAEVVEDKVGMLVVSPEVPLDERTPWP